jgi:hypothetical protein
MTSNEKSFGTPGRNVEEVHQKKILFLSSSEYGQANIILAVAYELLLRREDEAHIASFAPLKGRIKDLNKLASADDLTAAVFHTVPGPSALEALAAKDEFIGPYPPGIRGALDTYRVTLPAMATTWDEDEYILGYESCIHILQAVNLNIIVVDLLFSQGLKPARNYHGIALS